MATAVLALMEGHAELSAVMISSRLRRCGTEPLGKGLYTLLKRQVGQGLLRRSGTGRAARYRLTSLGRLAQRAYAARLNTSQALVLHAVAAAPPEGVTVCVMDRQLPVESRLGRTSALAVLSELVAMDLVYRPSVGRYALTSLGHAAQADAEAVLQYQVAYRLFHSSQSDKSCRCCELS